MQGGDRLSRPPGLLLRPVGLMSGGSPGAPPLASIFAAHLEDRGVVRLDGADAATFLQGLVTSDVAALGRDEAAYAALLTPQGKILFDFLATRTDTGFLIDVAAASAAALAKRLGFYRLRAKVAITDESAAFAVIAAWGEDADPATFAAAGATAFRDPRLAALGVRAIVPRDRLAEDLVLPGVTPAGRDAYEAHRLALGVPDGDRDFAFGDAFPHDADMDALNGVDFRKGCYVGQEVVSRMQHRGTARRRIVMVAAGVPLPPPGTEITAAGRPVGTLGSSAGGRGLALVRLDRAKAALDAGTPILAGDVPVALSIPAWAGFGWPAAAGDEG